MVSLDDVLKATNFLQLCDNINPDKAYKRLLKTIDEKWTVQFTRLKA